RPGRECLTAPVQRAEVLAQTEEGLIGFEASGQPAQAPGMPGWEMVVAATDIAIVWLVHKAHGARRGLQADAERSAIDLERQRSCCDRPAVACFIHLPFGGGRR